MAASGTVDDYLARAPAKAQAALQQVRNTVRAAAPGAVESISYGMPHYRIAGERRVRSRICYFGLTKNEQRVAFYTRPAFLERYRYEAAEYFTSKSALHFALDRPIPVSLIRNVVKNALRLCRATPS